MTPERLNFLQIALLTGYAAAMSIGQVLFKVAANRSKADGGLVERLIDLLQNGYFWAAVILYAAIAIVWVWILSVTPLSRAYPFVALAFVFTPLLAWYLFAEEISWRLVAGIAAIICGLIFVAV